MRDAETINRKGPRELTGSSVLFMNKPNDIQYRVRGQVYTKIGIIAPTWCLAD
jgi:hypothetical protein